MEPKNHKPPRSSLQEAKQNRDIFLKKIKPQRLEPEKPAAAIPKAPELLMYDEIEIKTLPDPKCKICWGTGKTTQRVSTGVPYVRYKPETGEDVHTGEYLDTFVQTECDCIVKKNVIKANKKLKAKRPKIIWNGRELSR